MIPQQRDKPYLYYYEGKLVLFCINVLSFTPAAQL